PAGSDSAPHAPGAVPAASTAELARPVGSSRAADVGHAALQTPSVPARLPTAASGEQSLPAKPRRSSPVAETLASATFVPLTLAAGEAGRAGVLDAMLRGEGVEAPGAARLRLAVRSAPVDHLKRLAFCKLADALDARVVPACAEIAVPVGVLVEHLDPPAQ